MSRRHEEAPGSSLPGLPNRIATTTFRDQRTASDQEQDDLFTWARSMASAARNAGEDRAKVSDPDYCRDLEEWIYNLPAGYEFDANTIRSMFGASNAAGAVVGSAARKRLIEHVGWTKSRAITRHGADIKIWRRS